jgi:hypothetical protein
LDIAPVVKLIERFATERITPPPEIGVADDDCESVGRLEFTPKEDEA